MKKFAGTSSSEKSKEIYQESLGEIDYGEFILGKNTTRIYNYDPKLLLFTLSRYKFVSKMFNGYTKVLEIGCQEGFGANLLSHFVDNIYAVDFYVPYIESCKRRTFNKNIKFDTIDILDKPIYENFDGAFALDVLEHIEKSHEDIFMKNIINSLNPSGSLILGMPSLESQVYASEASKIGHVNCKKAPDLFSFAKKYFNNVFLFSMNDEVLHTGYAPMSHYIFVLCCNKKI